MYPFKKFTGNRIDGMRTGGIPYPVTVIPDHFRHQLFILSLAPFRQLQIEAVEAGARHQRTHSHLFHRIGSRLVLMIHVGECRRPAFYHFKAGQFCTPIHIFIRQLILIRPNLLFQPGHQRHVITETTEKRHSRMCMCIHEAGYQSLTLSVDYLIRLNLQVRTDVPDLIFLNINIFHGIIQ